MKGECIRLLANYAKIKNFEDIRFKNRDEFLAIKDSKLKFGQVPALEVIDHSGNSNILVQTASILRYLAKIADPNLNLYPVDPIEAAFVDSIVDQEFDMFAGLSCSRYRERFGFECLDDNTVANVRKSLNDVVLPRHLSFLDKLLEKSPSGWLAGGSKPTIADFMFVPRLQWLESGANDGIEKSILEPFPRVQGLITKLLDLPEIKEYYMKSSN